MVFYECYFFSSVKLENDDKDDYWLIEQLCKANYSLSYDFYLQLCDLEIYGGTSDYAEFKITKQEIMDMDCEDFTEEDWWFIRTIYDCFMPGNDVIHIDMWFRRMIYIGK